MTVSDDSYTHNFLIKLNPFKSDSCDDDTICNLSEENLCLRISDVTFIPSKLSLFTGGPYREVKTNRIL